MILTKLIDLKEYAVAGLYEETDRSLFYRKALGLKRYFENCELYKYNCEFLYPSGTVVQKMNVVPNYMTGLAFNRLEFDSIDKEASELLSNDFFKYKSSVPKEHCVAGNMFTHSIPNYERILKEGILSYVERIEKIKDRDTRDGLLHLVDGIKIYINRCVSYLESVCADKKLIDALKKVPFSPASNLYEAVVSWNFIMYLDNCDNLGCVASGLYPYYKGEDITQLLENLFDNLDANCGYSMALGTDYNELTLQCLEASKGKRRPMIELFVNENTPDAIWNKAFEVIRTSNGQPAFYSESVLDGLKNKFPNISPEDIKKFCGGGCTESMLAGLSNVGSLDAGINLLLILEETIYSHLSKVNGFDDFYNCYIERVRLIVEKVTTEISSSQKMRAKYNPLPMRTLLIDDCIDNGIDYNAGGARYKWSIINFAGMINVIDSMLVIRDFVFRDKCIDAENFLSLFKSNDKEFLEKSRKHSVSFGNDNEDANLFSNQISSDIFSMLNNKKPYLGEGFIPASIQFMSQVDAGKNIGATPDGREAGAPLCDSLGAIFGKDRKGPTALLNSVTSLNLKSLIGIPVLNFNIEPSFSNNILKSLILGYMQMGGIQMQITCTSKEELLDAYENPSMHENLIVRVGGYSEYFCRLSDELKRMIIDRTIHN